MSQIFEQRLINILQFDAPILLEARLSMLIEDIKNSGEVLEPCLIERVRLAAETCGIYEEI